jgi:TPR repeat protein
VTFVSMLGVGSVGAGFVEAVDAYERGDFETAVRELRPLADDGNVEAQFYMAYMFETGKGLERDDGKAAEYYRKAGDQGHDRAQFNLGLAHERGRGVEQDLAQALEWYLKAANQGFARAQYKVADMYLEASGTRRDLMLSYQWFKIAGSQRYEDAKRRRKKVAREMTPYQIAEADMRVRLWHEAHDR